MSTSGNIADLLRQAAALAPERDAIRVPGGRDRAGGTRYECTTFAELNRTTDILAEGLERSGVAPGARIVLFVPFGREFIELTFALFKTGAIAVLIDPGMGRGNVFQCLQDVKPDGYIAVSQVHALRMLFRTKVPAAKTNVTVGRRWFWRGATYKQLLQAEPTAGPTATVRGNDPAAIIFTSGATGLPKGVLYEHGMFAAQVRLIRDFYGIQAGEIDLPGFPLFGLFNAAMGVTTVIPEMDPSRPAEVDPVRIVDAIREQAVTQAFGSPAFWNRVARYCDERGIRLATLKRALSAGGPVPVQLLERMARVLPEGADFHTPYGATESLPVASISGREVLERTAARTRGGAGTCVGRRFPGVDVKIIAITAGAVATLDEAQELPAGEIGEIIVRGESVTREYFARPDATSAAKIQEPPRCDGPRGASVEAGCGTEISDLKSEISDLKSQIADVKSPNFELGSQISDLQSEFSNLNCNHADDMAPDSVTGSASLSRPAFWHRIGDVGYLDADGLLWFCGRKAHVVETSHGRMFSVCCEAIFNEHPRIYRSALVGIGRPPQQTPVIVAEPEEGQFPETDYERKRLIAELLQLGAANPLTESIRTVLLHPSLPVDTRHNVKIDRTALAEWAAKELSATA